MNKSDAVSYINGISEKLNILADDIWEYAELSLQEYRSAARYIGMLRDEGFAVTEKLAGIDTAFCGCFGSGHPVIGILGEFDALSGLSQKPCSVSPEPLKKGGCGHGCGHNLLGAGALGAAMAVKHYLEQLPEGSGTVIFFGCPGEEGNSGKAFMAREGMFYGLDAALTWHPGSVNEVATGSNQTSMQVEYAFHGIASHAASAPHLGRSALDAVELMNTGVQYLREHMYPRDSVHYAITDAGGLSPNVVQAEAKVLYMVRSDNVPNTKKLLERVDKIAEGAALMTGTTLTRKFIDGTSNMLSNSVLEGALYDSMQSVLLPSYTDDELDFARKLFDTYPHSGIPGASPEMITEDIAFLKEASENGTRPLNDFIVPYRHSETVHFGSNDVGDVSWQTPTAYFYAAAWTSMSPGHSWQNVSIGMHPLSRKAMLWASSVLAETVIGLMEDPSVLENAKAEWSVKAAEGYDCPIEKDCVPAAIE
ncbi:MAG: amidohydrolase [Lachnospiraceae bacterium]|nr:amidohydrolase [Lachnospiraceae bacterium]